MSEHFDFIVVGGGAAGAVLAARLSERRDLKVLLLEAGGPPESIWIDIPIGIGKILGDERFIWPLRSEPELDGRRLQWHHGKVLGGSSSVNAMLFVRGQPERYDEWAAGGCPGWDFDSLLPFFKRLESAPFGDPTLRGQDGPIRLTRLEPEDPISRAFLQSCAARGIPGNDDYNGRATEGAAKLQISAHRGRRWSTARGYLEPARRRANLEIRTHAPVRRVIIREGCACGVRYVQDGLEQEASATREVILCAGALHTPPLLEHSGIGDGELLRHLGIQVVHHLSGVGKNLRDHLHCRVNFETNARVTANDLLNSRIFAARELIKYLLARRGLFATPSFRVHAYVRSGVSRYPDIRLQCALSSSESRYVNAGLDPFPGFHIGSYFLFPESRGEVHARSADPIEPPKAKANYLDHEDDVRATVWGVRRARELARTPPLRDLVVRELRPGLDVDSDEALLSYIRSSAETSWHPVGSCRMGSDADCVVDPELRVRGLDGLRVADASVIPFHTSSNTNAPSIMIGERAADLILNTRRSG